jgi:glycolate oxidase
MDTNYNTISEDLKKDFEKIVGPKYFFSEYEIRWTYAFGASVFNKDWIPDLILMPQNVQQVSDILKLANIYKIPVTPRGSGTSLSEGSLSAYRGLILDLSQMNKIISINIENNIVEVEPGVISDDLNEFLKDYGYFFPPDPASSVIATIGGMVATNSGGVQAFKYGVTKDYVLYLEIVLADGRILNLGSKTLKDVSSYNLKDLIISSEGTLAIITKIGLRIKPLPKKRKLGFYIFNNIEDLGNAVKNLRRIGIVPILLEFLDKLTTQVAFEFLGGDFLTYPKGYVLLAEIDGNTIDEIEEIFSTLHSIMIKNNTVVSKIAVNDQEREILISARKNALPALARISPTACLEDCSIQLTDFSKVIKQIERIPEILNIPNIKIATFGHMEGNLHPTFLFNENDPRDVEDFNIAKDYLYKEIVIPNSGTITGEHGIGKIKTDYLESQHGEDIVKIMRQIKKIFDPNMILNPGIGKSDERRLPVNKIIRTLKNQKNRLLELNCMRCGFCLAKCPSRLYYKSEAYSPRGRLSILNGLVFGDLILNNDNEKLVNDIINSCTLCGSCLIECPAGVPTYTIFEKAREIIHTQK